MLYKSSLETSALLFCSLLCICFAEGYAMCTGKPTTTRRVVAKECVQLDGTSMTFISGNCTGEIVHMSTYLSNLDEKAKYCQSEAIDGKVPVGVCAKVFGAWMTFACEPDGSLLLRYWEKQKVLPPPTPSLLRCSRSIAAITSRSGAAASQNGAAKAIAMQGTDSGPSDGILKVEYATEASLVDTVSFEVSLADGDAGTLHRPFIHFSTPLRNTVKIPGVVAGMQYLVRARTHLRGHSEGDPSTWSNLTEQSLTCTAILSSAASDAVQDAMEGRARTRWLEVYRQNTNGDLPDFLDAHNSADFFGQFSTYSAMMVDKPHPITRYCVELLDVTLPGIMTTSTAGQPMQSHFADYGSCMGGECICMVVPDRMITRQPREQISEACPTINSLGMCSRCSRRSLEASRNYTGMTVVPLPFLFTFVEDALPMDYPPPYSSPIRGHWFSHPAAGRCPPGVVVGEGGCTWQRSPLSHSVYADELIRLGVNTTFKKEGKSLSLDESVSLHNVEVGRKAFEALGLPPCGARASAGQRSKREATEMDNIVLLV